MNKLKVKHYRFRFVTLAALVGLLSSPGLALAQLDKRPDLAPDLKSNERKEEEDTKTDKNPLPMPGTTMTDERKKQIGEAMKDRPMTMDADKMRAGMRRQNLDYKILMVGSLTAQKAIAYGMQLRLSVQVKVDGAAPEDRVLFYVGLGASGSNEPIVTSERFEGQGPGPHIVSLVVPVEEPLVVDEGRLQADLFLLSEKLMPGLPGKQIVLKQPMQDKDPSNNRKALNYNVQQPEISLARVSRKGTNLDTVKVGERVELVVQARVTNGGTARNAITYAIGDPGTGRIDSAGPKVFHQGDGLTQEATVAFRVTPEQIVDGELRTTLFLLRNSEPSAPFAERLHTDSNPSDDRQIIRYPLADEPSLRKSNPLLLVIVHGKTVSGNNQDNGQSIGKKSHFYYYWGYPFIRQLVGDRPLYPWGSRDELTWNMDSKNSDTPLPSIITPTYHSKDRLPQLSVMTTYRDGSLSLKGQSERAIRQIHEQYEAAFERFKIKPDIVFIGHSMGGLVSRYIVSTPEDEMSQETLEQARYLKDRTRFIITIATPHDGSQAVDAAFEIDAGLTKLEELYSEVNPAAAPAIKWAYDKIRAEIDTNLPAMKDLSTEGLARLNRTALRPEKARRSDGTLVPIYVLGGRQPDAGFYTYKPGLKTHTDFKSLPGTIELLGELTRGGSESNRRAEEALGLMGIDFLLHRNDISGLLSGTHHPFWGINVGPQLDWGMVPDGVNNDLDIVQRTFKTTKPNSLQLKRPLPAEGVFWSKPGARPDEWPVYYWHGRQDGEIDSDGMVSIASSLGMRLGGEIVVWDAEFFHFDHKHKYDTGQGTERGSWYRFKRGHWDLDNHGMIHRKAHTGRWLWTNLLDKKPGPYTSSGGRSSWRKP